MAEQKRSTVTEAQFEVIKGLVSEIADTCHTVQKLAIEVVDGGDMTSTYGVAIRELSAKAGALADQCSEIMGVPMMCGSWDAWMLSPLTREALEKVGKEARHG